MNNGHNNAGNLSYSAMGHAPYGTMSHHEMPEHHALIDAANNSAIAMGMNLDLEDDGMDDEKGYGQQNEGYETNRSVASEAIQNFVMPDGFQAEYVPSWSKNRSIIFDYGVKACSSLTGKTIWFCLCTPQCQLKSSKGVGIAIKGAVTNCTNHLRDIHKIVSPRSAKITRRKPDDSDAEMETLQAGGQGYKKRPLGLLTSTRSSLYEEGHMHHTAQQAAHTGMLLATSSGAFTGISGAIGTSSASSSSVAASVLAGTNHSANEAWLQHFNRNQSVKYQVIAAPGMEGMAQTIAAMQPTRFLYHKTQWGKFPDGTDNIMIGGFQPVNRIAGENVLMLASFTNNSTTLTQMLVMVTLLQSFIESLTVVLPFYPVGTMERISREGQVATASTYAQMLSNLPNCGRPTRLVIYDLHTLQNRFYLHGNAIASMQTTIPLLIERMRSTHINCIAFPDDGALKRFGFMLTHLGFEVVTCSKTRVGEKRVIALQDGNPYGKHVIVIDDLAQSGSTVYQCGMACKNAGAASVSAFLAHAVFPNQSWRSFLPDGAHSGCFDRFFVTNSVPSVTEQLPQGSVFEVLDMSRKIVEDLDSF